jgi:hypothetical protein
MKCKLKRYSDFVFSASTETQTLSKESLLDQSLPGPNGQEAHGHDDVASS